MILLIITLCVSSFALAQRNYTNQSALSQGDIYKVGITQSGVYKLDKSFFSNLGITGSVKSSQLTILVNNISINTEKNDASNYNDDCISLPLYINDGGDGVIDNNDYCLFYAQGPYQTLWNKSTGKYYYLNNIYSDTAYYYIKLLGTSPILKTNNNSIQFTNRSKQYQRVIHYEKDLVNFLNSGKEWFGEEFSNMFGSSLSRNFSFNVPDALLNQVHTLKTSVVSRSIGVASNFTVNINSNNVQQLTVAANSGGFLDAFISANTAESNFTINNSSFNINLQYNPGAASAQGWLNWLELEMQCALTLVGKNQLIFSDKNSVGNNAATEFTVATSRNWQQVWDITNPLQPIQITVKQSSNECAFTDSSNQLKTYIAFTDSAFLTPVIVGKINNQNLHQTVSNANYLIVTHNSLLTQANQLAYFHTNKYGQKVVVATTDQIGNEFGNGFCHPVAIRNFVKMYYDKAVATQTPPPQFLCLFGAASFDYKNRISANTNMVPCFESANSTDPLLTYTSDDFYGILKDGEDVNDLTNPPLLSIAVGRIPVKNVQEAQTMVNKITNYHQPSAYGSWRNETIFVADDQDNNLHFNDAESISATAMQSDSIANISKVYIDAFVPQNNSSGIRYPDVNNRIINNINNGSLFFNYSGHGGYQRLADEAIFTSAEIQQLNNAQKLSLFITATCDFAPYDDPTKQSLGALLLQQNQNGAIALVTTTRTVFAFSNKLMNDAFIKKLLLKNGQNNNAFLGNALKDAKNQLYTSGGDVYNNRKFALLGDPGIQLALPKNTISIESITNEYSGILTDTLKALGKYKFSGKILNANNQLLSGFNGTVQLKIFDKPLQKSTLGNTPQSLVATYSEQNSLLFNGTATVNNGQFSINCILPKDINYTLGKGKLSLYAFDATSDAAGSTNQIKIGGNSNQSGTDKEPPIIQPFLNNEQFVSGGLTNESPILLVNFFDSSGINISGAAIGHNITAVIDGNVNNPIVLNNYYETNVNTYQKGKLRFQLPVLKEGLHTLTIKAWDVANNSGTQTIEFIVAPQQKLTINHLLNYPNPFTTKTNFWFEHNQPNTLLNVTINIFSITGKLVRQIQKSILTDGNRVTDIEWDGKDTNNEKIGRGVYIYRIIVHSTNGSAEASQKLYLL